MRRLINQVIDELSPGIMFPSPPVVHSTPERDKCSCSQPLFVWKTNTRKVFTLDIGEYKVIESYLYCKSCGRVFRPQDLDSIVPEYCNIGYDILVYVGRKIFLDCENEKIIQKDLKSRNIIISCQAISDLGRRFVMYLALAHKQKNKKLRTFMKSNGGYILHLDATCEGDSPHIMTALDEISNIVMNTIKISSEKSEVIIPFLKKLKCDFGNPIAVVSDMGKGIMSSVKSVFPGIPYFICHFHFLRDIGKDLLELDYAQLKKCLRKFNIKVKIRNVIKLLQQDNVDSKIKSKISFEKNGKLQVNKKLKTTEHLFLLLFWVISYRCDLQGLGFPFDLDFVALFRRLEQAYLSLLQLQKKSSFSLPVRNCIKCIANIIEDSAIAEVMGNIIKAESIFRELRTCMEIVLPGTKQGLNDGGSVARISTIKRKIFIFRNSKKIITLSKIDVRYKKMIKQIDKYWEYLFADPLTIKTADEMICIQPQRTNNILEQFFRDLKRRFRKKNGTRNLSKPLKTMLASTPLIKNLENPEYVKIIKKHHNSLEELFASIDSEDVRKLFAKNNESKMEKSLRKISKIVKFPEQLCNE